MAIMSHPPVTLSPCQPLLVAKGALGIRMTDEPERVRRPGLDGSRALYTAPDKSHDRQNGAASDIFRAFAENSADTIIRADPKGILLYVSPACRAWGYEPEDLIGTSGAELVHADDLARFSANLAQVFAGGDIDRTIDREIRYRRKDGGWVWLEGNPQAIRDASGRVVELLNVFRDVSERRRLRDIEVEHRATEELFENAFHHASIGKALVGLDGRFMKINPAFCNLVGYSADEMLDLDFQTITHPEDLDADLGLLGSLMAGEIPSYKMDKRYIRADQTVVWVHLSVSMVADSDGRPKHLIAQVQDLTASKEAEAALAQSEQRFRRLAVNAPDMIAESTLQGVMTYVSPASLAITGFTPEELVGRAFSSLMHPDDALKVLEMCQAIFASKGVLAPSPVEFRAQHKSGHEIWLECKPTLAKDPVSGQFTGLTDIIRDITARKALEAQLRLAQADAESAAAVKGEFLANMSHELRTPLTSIVGFTRLAAEQADLQGLTRTYVERVGEASRALLCTVNDILDFSKLEVGQVSFHPEPTSLAKLSRATLDLFMPQAGAKDLDLALDCDVEASDLVISIDPDRIRQILLNLVGNAVKFTDSGGVTLRTRYDRASEMLSIEVIDTGPGILPDRHDRLFKRFSQVDGALTRSHGGTGLGLAICKGLVEAMGGKIGADSRAGEGSRFWLTIPAPLADAAGAIIEGPDTDQTPVTGVRVLVVDDHPANRELARLILAGIGAEVSEATDGEEAALLASEWPYDVILMDLRMPRLDGPGALARIREGPGPNATTPILAFTADADTETAVRVAAMGFQDVVAKPLEPGTLVAAVARATAFLHGQLPWDQTDAA
jgi:PAS domain S-box-containing protein